jgi:hypothetical protein
VRVIYTAVTGGYDTLKSQPVTGAEYVAYTDGEIVSPWSRRSIDWSGNTDCRRAKLPRVLAHAMFPNVEYSMWVDASITLKPADFDDLIARYLSDCDIAVAKHPCRVDHWEELKAAIEGKRMPPEDIPLARAQLERYDAEGYGRNSGICETGVILRRHTLPVALLNEAWWKEIENGSQRCQLSFPYVAWKLGIPYHQFKARSFFTVGHHAKPILYPRPKKPGLFGMRVPCLKQ